MASLGFSLRSVFVVGGEVDGMHSIQALSSPMDDQEDVLEPYRLPPGSSNKELCGHLNFSSGTTGWPKAVR